MALPTTHVHVIFYYYLLIYFLIYSLPFLYKLINIFSMQTHTTFYITRNFFFSQPIIIYNQLPTSLPIKSQKL
jgi:hypothetical protein